VGALLAPHPRGPQPSALGDFSVPTASEGRAIPVVFGTCMIKGGNTVWWGDLKSKAIKVGGGILGQWLPMGGPLFGPGQVTGFKYYLGCQFMLCHGPVDALVDIQADVKSIPRTTAVIANGNGSENYIQVKATGDRLFGGTGPGGGGGISGIINFYRGLDTQQPDEYLSAKQGRIVLDQSGIGYTYSGVGNGGITALSAGSKSIEETFTITAIGIDHTSAHSTFNKMRFSVVGSVSGSQTNNTLNPEGSNGCWADQAFSCSRINLTVQTGATQYVNGDTFTVKTQHSHVAPAYRKLCYAVFQQLYVGTSNYLKPLAFVVRRCPDPLAQGAGIANINGDANPALAVYEALTNVDWGLGIPAARIDATSFAAAAVTLASEGLGISMMFDTQASADQLTGEILRHCDGLAYTDPATGLWTIVLARGGYDPSTLPVLTVDSIIGTPDISRGSWRETTNLLTVSFLSRANNFNDRVVRAYDAANIAVTGEVRPQTIEFKGISSEAAAGLVAARVLKTLSYPLAKGKLVADRSAWQFRQGGLFRFTWVPLGIINQVLRITRIAYGELTDGKISIDVVEDIFGINSVAFVAPPASGWVNPAGAPLANAYEQLVEVPLHIALVAGSGGIFVMAMAVRNLNTAANSFEIWLDEGSGFFDSGQASPFCPIGFLAADYPVNTLALDPAGFTLTIAGIDLVLLEAGSTADMLSGVKLLMIDGEIMGWQTPTANSDGTFTISPVLRGVMDTVPAAHAAGAKVWFFSEGAGFTKGVNSYEFDLTVTAKLLPSNSSGSLPITSATAETVTTHSRVALPYPPGNFRMQGQPYGTRFRTIVGDLGLSWSIRNSSAAGQTPLMRQDDGDAAPPLSVAYELDASILGVGHALPGGGVTSTSPYIITAETRAGFSGAGDAPLTVKVFSFKAIVFPVPATLYCLQPQSLDVIFTGFGLTFGEFFGGLNS
jgi:hypothetical protein